MLVDLHYGKIRAENNPGGVPYSVSAFLSTKELKSLSLTTYPVGNLEQGAAINLVFRVRFW
jgi:hypothetical protein